MAFVLHFLRSGDGFLDAGANIGSYTVLASAVVGTRSLAVEPHPITFERLRRNLFVNELTERVSARQVALGASRGEARLTADHDTMNQVVGAESKEASVEVELWPLDDLLGDFPALLWKIDVEGFEEQVLSGASHSLERGPVKAILLETVSSALSERLLATGFEAVSYDPFHRRFEDPAKSAHNALWIRDRDFCEERVQNASRFEVFEVSF